jgi:hypothetical protein
MNLSAASVWVALFTGVPLLGVPAFLLIFYFRRAIWRQKKRPGRKHLGFSTSTFTLGIALQHLQALTHPNVEYVIQEIYDEAADQDDQGDPDDPKTQLKRQLRRIRLGQPVDRLILRLR